MGHILTVNEVAYVAYELARRILHWDEPIPPFNTRFPNILESCLATPFQSFGGKALYPRFIEKASILFYLMIKNHPFKNGNKRIAMTTMLYFLMQHKKWLRVNNFQFYKFTIWVAESDAVLRDSTVDAIEQFISLYLVNFDEKE